MMMTIRWRIPTTVETWDATLEASASRKIIRTVITKAEWCMITGAGEMVGMTGLLFTQGLLLTRRNEGFT